MPGLSLRTASLVTTAVLLRVVGYDQLRRLAYGDRDASAVRKDVRAAEDAGWLTRWSFPVPGYGRIGHVHPTARANAAVLPALRASLVGRPWAALVGLMMPSTPRPALDLRGLPKWFAHQREVNHLVTSLVCSGDRPLVWASAWNDPFPPTVGHLTMPQPDYVVIAGGSGGAPDVAFGEHDRGHEPVARFIARKVALYSALSGACASILGVETFRVDVSVIDEVAGSPVARLRALLDATRAYGTPVPFRFTVGGWLFDDPSRAVWFRHDGPVHDSVRMQDHLPSAGEGA